MTKAPKDELFYECLSGGGGATITFPNRKTDALPSTRMRLESRVIALTVEKALSSQWNTETGEKWNEVSILWERESS